MTPSPGINPLAPISRATAWNTDSPESSLSFSDSNKDEEIFNILSSFDTVLIIDDTASMMVVPSRNQDSQSQDCWRVLTDFSKQATEIVTVHDPDGISFRFLKAQYLDRAHVKTVVECMDILAHIDLSDGTHGGGTELLGQLEEVVNEKLSVLTEYRRQQARMKPDGSDTIQPDSQPAEKTSTIQESPKGLNLIVITDGQVDDGDEVENYIIGVARELDRLNAPPAYINIQFVQVGDDQSAGSFLNHLGDELRNQEDSPRDVGSTTHHASHEIEAISLMISQIVDFISLDDEIVRKKRSTEQVVRKILVGEIAKQV